VKIAIGADHRGFECKKLIVSNVTTINWLDVGCFSSERCGYPEFAKLVVQSILDGHVSKGILLCASGIGMSMAANRFNKIYAGLCWTAEIAKIAKEDDNINVLVIPTDFVTPEQCLIIINSWLKAEFKSGVHRERLDQIDRLV
jgi:ribose 5-phosphate isomerase B